MDFARSYGFLYHSLISSHLKLFTCPSREIAISQRQHPQPLGHFKVWANRSSMPHQKNNRLTLTIVTLKTGAPYFLPWCHTSSYVLVYNSNVCPSNTARLIVRCSEPIILLDYRKTMIYVLRFSWDNRKTFVQQVLRPIFRSDVRTNVRWSQVKKFTCEFSKSALICEQDRKPVPTF